MNTPYNNSDRTFMEAQRHDVPAPPSAIAKVHSTLSDVHEMVGELERLANQLCGQLPPQPTSSVGPGAVHPKEADGVFPALLDTAHYTDSAVARGMDAIRRIRNSM